ncbi:MAG: ABC transporter substrate-binding protein [Desulforhopalus sp.]|nr:ABC transporter substrate-binding protein [Desulforhopalus sp.]
MKKKRYFFVPWPVFLLWLLLSSPLHAADAIKIAAIFPATGQSVAEYGMRPHFSGIRLAVRQINDAGGLLGHPVELLEFGDQSTALGAKQAAQEAIKAKAVAVIGASRSSFSLAMAPVLQAAGIPMITPVSTSPEITLVGDYIFRVCFIDDFQGEVMATFAVRELGARTAVVLTNTSQKFSLSLAGLFIEKFKKLGGKILWEGDYLGDAVNFEEQLVKVKELNPDVCFVPGYDTDTGFIVKQSREMGIQSIFLSGDGLQELYKYAGNAAAGTLFVSHWHQESQDPASRQFVQRYQKESATTIDPIAALSYDAVMLLADAVRRANSPEPVKIRAALAKTRGFTGVTGDITFDANRNPVDKSAVVLKFEKDSWVYVKTITP